MAQKSTTNRQSYCTFLFRVLLIAGIAGILGFIFQWSEGLRNWIAMIIAAGVFSSFHFIGEFGDYFSFNIPGSIQKDYLRKVVLYLFEFFGFNGTFKREQLDQKNFFFE